MSGLILKMPRVPGSASTELDMDMHNIYHALGRIEELAALTPMKAQELMTAFNRAYLVANRYANVVLLEKNKATTHLARVRAVLTLETVPIKLAAKGLKATKANVDAFCMLDEAYSNTQDVLDKLDAEYSLLKGHLKSLEMAYTGAKKVLGDRTSLLDQRVEINGASNTNNYHTDTVELEYAEIEAMQDFMPK